MSGRSITIRSGEASVKAFASTGRDRSNVSTAPGNPGRSLTATATGFSTAASAVVVAAINAARDGEAVLAASWLLPLARP